MNLTIGLRNLSLVVLLALISPVFTSAAATPPSVPPDGMFQLPWDQGTSWVAIDGLDNGTDRVLSSSHYYLSGGAIDFAPHNDMIAGENTSNDWVTAAAAGTVIETSSCHLKIDHGNGWVTEYQFLGNIRVKVGDAVYRNQRLAVIADGVRLPFCPPTTDPDIPHLHFMLRPSIRNASFSGWLVGYNPLNNATTFSKNGQSFSLFKPLLNVPNLQVVLRTPLIFETMVSGSVDSYLYERWPMTLSAATSFTLTATAQTSGLVPLLVLMDASGQELARGTGTLSATQPAGSYFVQVQPQTGNGFYQLLAHDTGTPGGPTATTVVSPTSIGVGGAATVTVNLAGIPSGGYTSAEFTCSYDAALVGAGNISAGGLFGGDPVVAIQGPQTGHFIFAIAGSNGNKAGSDGPVFTFTLTALQAGQIQIACAARVSNGNNALLDISSLPGALTVGGATPTLSPSAPVPVITVTATPTISPTVTSTPVATGSLNGQVLAGKPVGVNLFNPDKSLAASVAAGADGKFTLSAPSGSYLAVASAAGYLSAQATVNLGAGVTSLPTLTLVAGDIDNNNVIDQFDAMTIGMNYNAAMPATADLNNDGVINVLDLEIVARNYRKTGPLPWQ